MPSEPDNRMDDLLKTYAKKRRAEAGAPLDMHPATRRLLQAEAAKLRPKAPERSQSWFGAMLALWPRLAAAASLVLILGVTVWMFRPPGETPRGMMELAKQDSAAEVAFGAAPQSPAAFERVAQDPGSQELDRGAQKPAKESGASRLAVADAPRPIRRETEVRLRDTSEAAVPMERAAIDTPAKRKLEELAANRPEPSARRNIQPVAPAAQPPPASGPTQPARPAILLAAVETPAAKQESAPATRAPADAKDRSGASSINDSYLTAGKTLALGDELNRNQPATTGRQKGTGLFNDGATLSYFSQAPPVDSQLAEGNAPQLGAQNSLSLFANNSPPLAEDRAQRVFGLNTNSLDNAYAISPNLGLDSLRYGGVNPSSSLAQNADNYRSLQSANTTEQKPVDALALRADGASGKNLGQQQVASAEQNASRFYRANVGDAEKQGQIQAGGRFTQVRAPAPAGPAKKPADPAAAILTNFVLEQSGERIRVVDADNSVYDGQLLAEQAANEAGKPAEAKLQLLQKRAASADTITADSGRRNFRVSGMNRTLQQPVVLEGVLFETAESGRAAQTVTVQTGQKSAQTETRAVPASQVQGGAASQVSRAQNSQAGINSLNVRRIQGQVRIGATNQSAFDAVRSGN